MNGIRFLSVALIASALVSCAPRAHAQELPSGADSIQGMKSGSTAFLLSFLGTAVPIAAGLHASKGGDGALLGGFVIGPSLGHFYAGRSRRAFLGIGLRTASLVGMSALASRGGLVEGPWGDHPSDSQRAIAGALFVIGTAAALGDIVSAPASAREHNEKLRRNRLTMSPARIGGAPGLRLSWAM